MSRSIDIEFRLETHVSPEPNSGCWLWTGALNTSGYATTWWRGKGARGHRTAWELWRGPVPEGLCVLHRCDERSCINPRHLFLGTKRDNALDMMAKDRAAIGRRHGLAKLDDAKVAAMRRRYALGGISHRGLAEEFGVHTTTACFVVQRRTWKHVKD